MAGSLRGPRAKIERAKKHIGELELAVSALVFSNTSHPHVITVESDPQAGNKVYKVGKIPPVPDGVAAIAGDAIHNLRSSLDLLMSQLVERRRNPGSIYFPTASNRKRFEARCKAEVQACVDKDAFDLVCASEAYRGGNGDAAWRVHRLDIEDKHRVVYELGFHLRSQTLGLPGFAPSDLFSPEQTAEMNRMLATMLDDLFYRPADTMFPLKEGDVLFTGPPKQINDPKFRLDITFAQPRFVQGETVLPAITQLSQAVETIVEAFSPLF